MAATYIKPSEKDMAHDGFGLSQFLVKSGWIPEQGGLGFLANGRIAPNSMEAISFPHKKKALVFLRRQWRRYQRDGVTKW